jgi:hypothetical protein
MLDNVSSPVPLECSAVILSGDEHRRDFLTNQPFYFELCTCNNEALSKKQVCTSGGIMLFVTISPILFAGHVYEAQARHPKRILGLAAGHASSCATCEYGLSMFTHSDLSRNHLPVGPMTRFHS